MTCETHLSAKHTPFANLGTAGYTHLRRHHGVGTDVGVVGNLNQVVELHALANVGRAHGRAVNASVGTNLHIILDGYDTNLRNLVVSIRSWSEAEAISTDDTTCMESHVIAELTAVINGYVRVDEGILANLHTLADVGVRINLATFAHLGTIADISESANIDVLCHLSLWRNKSQWVDACLLWFHRLVHLKQLSHTFVGVLHTDEGSADWMFQFYGLINEHDARLRVVHEVSVFRVRKERDCTFLAFFDFCEGVDCCILITFHTALNELGYLLSGKFHNLSVF